MANQLNVSDVIIDKLTIDAKGFNKVWKNKFRDHGHSNNILNSNIILPSN